MKRAALTFLVLVIACTSHEAPEPPSEPAVPVAQGEAVVPGEAVAQVEAVAQAEPETAGTWLWRSDEPEPSTPGYLLGVVGQSGVSTCPDGGYDRKWLAVVPKVGRVGVSGPPDSVFDEVMDQPVLVVGQPGPAPERAPITETIELCPPLQMRSDWRETPRGMLVRRSPSPGVGHFQVTAMRSLHELTARLEGDHVVVSLLNPVPVALRDVELRVHYEGCFGKPGTRVEATAIGELGMGAVASARVPALTSRPDAPKGRQAFRASSVQLVATGDGVVVDLDVWLRSLGADTECPKRR